MRNIRLIILILVSIFCISESNAESQEVSVKKERNYIREGNRKYEESKFRDAEVAYRKALEINPSSEIAKYNLASALMKQSGTVQADSPNNPIIQADSLFKMLVENGTNNAVVEKSYYNLGNIAFDKQEYVQSISMYKGALRINPNNDDARENLRLAQLKLKEQQNQNKNKDKNKDNDKQDQQNKNNQDNEQNQNKQNKEQNNQDKNKDNKDKQPQSPSQDRKNQQKNQPGQGISDDNAEKILKTMENEENATRRKVNALKKKEEERNASRRQTTNQW